MAKKMKPVGPDNGISMKEQIAYGCGEIAANPLYTIALSFLTYFYSDVVGVNIGIVGTIILISRLTDGFTDIIAGNIVDHTYTPQGSARPWILRMSIPMALSCIVLFTVPKVGPTGQAVYVFISYNFAMSIVYTMFYAAHAVLPVFMTGDPKTRSGAYSMRIFIGGVFQMILSVVFLGAVEKLGGGQAAWIKLGCILAVITLVGCAILYFGTEERNNARIAGTSAKVQEKTPLLQALKIIVKNKYWWMALGVQLVQVVHQVLTLTLGVYFAKYVLEDVQLTGSLVLFHHAPALVLMPVITVLLNKGMSKRNICLIGVVALFAGTILSAVTLNHTAVIISLAIRGIGFACLCSTMYGMVADSVDYGEWKTGTRCEAVSTSVNGISTKLGTGLGTAAFGAVLAHYGYDGTLAVQPAAAVSCIKSMFTLVPLVPYVILLLILIVYKLDKEMPKIKADLAERKAAEAEAVAAETAAAAE